MPNYKVVDADQLDADLKVVADAIRAKGATQEELAFPSGFVGAVEGISGDGGDKDLLYYTDSLDFSSKALPAEMNNAVLRVLNCKSYNRVFAKTSGIKNLKIICDTQGLTVNLAQMVRENTDLETLDVSEFVCYPTDMSYFALGASNLKSIHGALDFSQCTNVTIWLNSAGNLEDIEFVPNTIKITTPFHWCHKLTKASFKSIIAGLADDVSGQTVELSKTAVNNAFETSEGAADGSSSAEWAALIATKPNWTIALG